MLDIEADYLLDEDGRIRPNPLCEGLEERYRTAVIERQRLWRGRAALILVQVFRANPWLDEVQLSITISFEYDDAGGYYRSMHLRAEAIEPAPSALLPEVHFGGGQWDRDIASELIESMLDDESYDLYEALSTDPVSNEDLTLHLDRERIAPLLIQEHISGAAVLATLFPELDPAPPQASLV